MPGRKREPFDPWLIPPAPPEPQPTPPAEASSPTPFTVSQLTAAIAQAISRTIPATVHVIGQISNLKQHTSGHLYFTLKDAQSELACVMWRTDAARLKYKPSDGLEVIATGGVEVFERAGRYQLYVRRIEPRGVGSLELAFRQLYERLAKEGLFAPMHKKLLPKFPRQIGIVTSPTGAALADMLRTIARRFPCIRVLILPVRVQGSGAAEEVAAAVALANARADQLGGLDVLIVARGGGSLEDLWAFNEEPVARAVFASRIPVISGVGHEVDTTICDLVADVRAATPTAAAQIAIPVLEDVLHGLTATELRLGRAAGVRRDSAESRLSAIFMRSPYRDPQAIFRTRGQTIDLIVQALQRGVLVRQQALRAKLDRCEQCLQKIAPHKVLAGMSLRLSSKERRMRDGMWRNLGRRLRDAQFASLQLERASPARLIPAMTERTLKARARLTSAETKRLAELTARVQAVASLMQAVSHKSVLERGFTITRRADGGGIVRSIHDVEPADRISTQVGDGTIDSIVEP